jgi:ubiquinone/menaquinone biosynthesis C-methylase UbiE
VQLHLEQASAACACTTELGDARHLRARDASHDVALLLGPLYHLPEHADRLQALREARRVVRPGGLVAVAAISRHSTVLDLLATARLAGAGEQSLRSVLETGRHDPSLGFTTAYFHTAEELVSEMTVAGLTDVTLHGVEGPGWASLLAIQTHTGHVPAADAPLMTSAVSAARLTESDPALVASSAHFLAFGRA